MEIEEALYAYLSTHTRITDVCSTRVYPLQLPQNPTYPAMVYRRVTTERWMAHDGPGDLAGPRFQFDCYGETYSDARAVANELRAVLNGYRGRMGGSSGVEVGGIFFLNEVDDFGDQVDVYRVAVDYRVLYEEG